MVDDAGFLTATGIEAYVATYIKADFINRFTWAEPPLLLFKSQDQQTWLVRAGETIYCLLDDANTRAGRNLVQLQHTVSGTGFKGTYGDLSSINYKDVLNANLRDLLPGRVRDLAQTRLVDLGFGNNWYYSRELFPQPSDLEAAVNRLLGRAKGQAKAK
jgi:hypothetical protein